jgi:uncharacterized lipoprotein YbaY
LKTLILAAAFLSTAAAAGQPSPTAPETALGTMGFICGDGQLIEMRIDRAAGILVATRSGQAFTLQEQVGRVPPRYVTGSDSIDLDGDTAHLIRGREERQQCRRVPDAPQPGTIWGTLTKLDRMALVPGTRAKVLLVDAARADAPAVEIASTAIVTTGNQVPLHFLITYPPERVQPRPMAYRLQARIERPDGGLLYTTDSATFVVESAAPQPPVELRLVPVGSR